MRNTRTQWGVPVLATGLLASAFAQTGAQNGEWRAYGGDLGNTHYSSLDQIKPENFNKLQIAWRFHTENLGAPPEYNMEGTPLMVGGILYTTAGSRRDVVALDASNGELLWMHREDEAKRGLVAPRRLSGRGLSYWTDGKEERILYVTPGYRLIALDAKTGSSLPGFGAKGVIDLKMDDDQEIDPENAEIGYHAAPVVAGDTIIVGAAHKTGGVPTSKTNVKGYVRAFDVRTGKRLWIFHTIPLSNEFGFNTWEKDSSSYTGNTGVWGQISVDEKLGVVYLPVELPTGDYYGGHRPGTGLFGESIVALDLKTGKRLWHYQLVHHGIWDMDIPDAPILVDITHEGQTVKALAQPTKQNFLYIFDRTNGKSVFGMEERPVEKGDVPGEWYSPTQPFPLKPPAYDGQGFTEDYVINFTPELHAEGLKLAAKYKLGPVFTPGVVSKPEGPYGTIAMGTTLGGTNWQGGSVDPETHIAYVPSQRLASVIGLIPSDGTRSDFAYITGSAAPRGERPGGGGEGGSNPTVQGLPLVKPPYGSISAIDLDKGEILWQIAHGDTPDSIKNHPALKGVSIPRTGRSGIFGVLVTKTMLVSGERSAGTSTTMLRAYDKATGKDAGAVLMPAGETGTPMTYMAKGKQYIVLAIGAPGFPAELIAYKLGE